MSIGLRTGVTRPGVFFHREPLRPLARPARARLAPARAYPHVRVGEFLGCESPVRLLVMAHGDTFWHGHPSPLAAPEGHFRAAVSAYYYVAASTAADEEAHGAIWAK